jgi:hypothetical protein
VERLTTQRCSKPIRRGNYYDDLTEFYFSRREAIATPAPTELSKLEILKMAIESEEGRLAEKERADHAERTKAQISRKREASTLGKLSAATRRCRIWKNNSVKAKNTQPLPK